MFKKKTKKVIFLNFYKKLTWKIRASRQLHWNSIKSGKLNRFRYRKLIKTVNKSVTKPQYNDLIYFFLQMYKLILSWKQIINIVKFQLWVVNGKYNTFKKLEVGDIVEGCFGPGLVKFNKIQGYFNKKIFYRVKRWSYNSYNRKYFAFKQPYKLPPKSYKSLVLGYKKFNKNFVISKALGVGALLYKQPYNYIRNRDDIYKTTILKLHNWRYKF